MFGLGRRGHVPCGGDLRGEVMMGRMRKVMKCRSMVSS
jgi:hypothetical protein